MGKCRSMSSPYSPLSSISSSPSPIPPPLSKLSSERTNPPSFSPHPHPHALHIRKRHSLSLSLCGLVSSTTTKERSREGERRIIVFQIGRKKETKEGEGERGGKHMQHPKPTWVRHAKALQSNSNKSPLHTHRLYPRSLHQQHGDGGGTAAIFHDDDALSLSLSLSLSVDDGSGCQ